MSDGRVAVLLMPVGGAVAGLLVGGAPGAVVGGAVGAATGLATWRTGIRPLVAVAVVTGTAIGAVVGRSVVSVLCAPASCIAVEWIAGIATGAGAFVGVGLVVALAARSFEEYHEAVAARRPPPEPAEDEHEFPS